MLLTDPMLATGGSALCAINVRWPAAFRPPQAGALAPDTGPIPLPRPLPPAQVLKDAGVAEERILFINVVTCPEGVRAMADGAPGVKIVTAAMDEGLNEDKYIVPGLGDFGDRYFATV